MKRYQYFMQSAFNPIAVLNSTDNNRRKENDRAKQPLENTQRTPLASQYFNRAIEAKKLLSQNSEVKSQEIDRPVEKHSHVSQFQVLTADLQQVPPVTAVAELNTENGYKQLQTFSCESQSKTPTTPNRNRNSQVRFRHRAGMYLTGTFSVNYT